MLGHFGFSYVGLIYLLMLFIPNLFWSRRLPADFDASKENKWLQWIERVGQVCCTCSILFFRDYNLAPFTPWSLWLIASFLLILLYEIGWIRYFTREQTSGAMYRSLCGIPVPLASLPVAAFLLLGIYGKVLWLILSALLLGVGHIGIHIQHLRAINIDKKDKT